MAPSKLKSKYDIQTVSEAFYTGSKIQISKDGKELICDCVTSITFVDVNTGQASASEDSVLGKNVSKPNIIYLEEDEDESDDSFKNARIKMDFDDQVTAMKLSPSGEKLLVACKSLLLKLYSWPDRKLVQQFRSYHRSPVLCLDWDASSTMVVSGSADKTARVWDTANRVSTHCLRDAGDVLGCVSFHPRLREHPLVYAGAANKLYVWHLSAGSNELLHSIDDAHYMNITALQHTADGKHLVSCSLDRALILWQSVTMAKVRVVMVGQAVGGAVILPHRPEDQEGAVRVLLGGESGHVSIWRADTGCEELKSRHQLVSPPEDRVGVLAINSLHYCHTLRSVMLTSYESNVLFVNVDTLSLWKMLCGNNEDILATLFVTAPVKTEKESTDEAPSEAASDDASGRELLVVATNSPEIRMYRTRDLTCRLLCGHTKTVLALARHPVMEDVFASSSRDHMIRVWRATAECGAVCVAVAEGHSHIVATVTFGMDMIISGSKDTCIKRWPVTETKFTIIKSESKVKGQVLQLAGDSSSHAGPAAGAMAPNTLLCSNTQVGHEKDVNSVCVSPKDRLVATGSEDKTIKVWTGRDLSLVSTLRGHKRGVWCVQFAPVDKLLVSASADQTIKIWMVDSMTLAASLEDDSSGVLAVSWINKGLQLVSTSSAGLLKVWEVKTRLCIDTLEAHSEARAWALDTKQDGAILVTGGADAKFVIWKDVTEEVTKKEADEQQRLQSEKQTLANLLKEQRWDEALELTLRLDQPYNALKVIRELLWTRGEAHLGPLVDKLQLHQLGNLVRFIALWNTRASTCDEAQKLLFLLLSTRRPEELEKIPFWQHSLEGLLSYTNRHYNRFALLNQSAQILGFAVDCMSMRNKTNTLTLKDKSSSAKSDVVEEIDDLALLNQFLPDRQDLADSKKDEEDEEEDSSSDSDDEGLTEGEKNAMRSLAALEGGSDSDSSQGEDGDGAADDYEEEAMDEEDIAEQVKSKKKKKSKKVMVEDLDEGYMKEKLPPPPSEDEEEDEGVESGASDMGEEDYEGRPINRRGGGSYGGGFRGGDRGFRGGGGRGFRGDSGGRGVSRGFRGSSNGFRGSGGGDSRGSRGGFRGRGDDSGGSRGGFRGRGGDSRGSRGGFRGRGGDSRGSRGSRGSSRGGSRGSFF